MRIRCSQPLILHCDKCKQKHKHPSQNELENLESLPEYQPIFLLLSANFHLFLIQQKNFKINLQHCTTLTRGIYSILKWLPSNGAFSHSHSLQSHYISSSDKHAKRRAYANNLYPPLSVLRMRPLLHTFKIQGPREDPILSQRQNAIAFVSLVEKKNNPFAVHQRTSKNFQLTWPRARAAKSVYRLYSSGQKQSALKEHTLYTYTCTLGFIPSCTLSRSSFQFRLPPANNPRSSARS